MAILDDLYAVMDRIRPIQYYATVDYIERGKVFMIKQTDFYPKIIIMHPDDFEAKRAEMARHCRLTPFEEWKPTEADLHRAWQKLIDDMRESLT